MKKEILVLTSAVLLAPTLSNASPKPIDFSRHESTAGFFASIQYKPAVPHFASLNMSSGEKVLSTLSLKKEGAEAKNITSKDSYANEPYVPSYEKSMRFPSGSVGYSTGTVRLEAEGIYQDFLVNTKKFEHKENAYTFAIYLPKDKDAVATETPAATSPANPLGDYYVTTKNKTLSVMSLIGNLCYDVLPTESKFSPYICGGGGISFAKFLGVTSPRLSFQGKIGVQYFISRKSVVFVSGYAQKTSDGSFDKVPVTHQIVQAEASGSSGRGSSSSTSASIEYLYPDANLGVAYWGLEFGIRLIL